MVPAIRLVRLIQIAMVVGIGFYVVVGERLARAITRSREDTLFHALSFISISLVGATMVLRRTLVVPAEAALACRPDDDSAAARWKMSYVFLYATCELVGLFGLILRLAGLHWLMSGASIWVDFCFWCFILRERRSFRGTDLTPIPSRSDSKPACCRWNNRSPTRPVLPR